MIFGKIHIISLLVALCSSLAFEGHSQTKISIPPAKVEFNALGKTKIKGGGHLKQLKKIQQEKKSKLKEVKHLIKKNGSLPKDSISFYTNMFSSLTIPQLDSVITDLEKMKENYSPSSLKDRGNREIDKRTDHLNEVPIISDISIPDSLDIPSIRELDSLQFSIDSLQYKKLIQNYKEQLGIYMPDSTFFKKYVIDSILLDSLFRAQVQSLPDSSILAKYAATPLNDQDSVSSMEDYLEHFVQNRVQQNIDLPLPENTPDKADVKQYIPSLEKFDFEKPTIPDKKLIDAMIKKEVEEKKDKATSLLSTKEEESKEKMSFTERFLIGGYFQYIPSPQSIELTPSIAFRVTNKWRIGSGYSENISFSESEARRRAMRVFVEFDITKGFYTHLESDWAKETNSEKPAINQRSTYLGLGKSVTFRLIQSDLQFLYNFDAPNLIHKQRFVFRYGINFTK